MNNRFPRVLFPFVALALAACANESEEVSTNAPAGVNTPPDTTAPAIDFGAFEQAIFGDGSKAEGAVIQHQGKVVYEKYVAGFTATNRHLAYSVSKSVGSALLGIAVNDGLLEVEDSVCKYVPKADNADPKYCDTTVGSLVQMTSGLKWDEGYADPATSNVLPMLYGDEADMGLYVARQPRANDAGKVWNYSSGDSNLLARAIRGALAGKDMRAWANEKLFVPAGLSSAIFESDQSGTLLFASGVFMTPRDMARFGQLYLDGGMAGTTRVLSTSWVDFSSTPAPAVAAPKVHKSFELKERGGSYGASFWLNAAAPDAPTETLLYANAPRDLFCAQGTWGQRICMVPSRKLVIVRVGNDGLAFYNVAPGIAAAVKAIDDVNAKGGK